MFIDVANNLALGLLLFSITLQLFLSKNSTRACLINLTDHQYHAQAISKRVKRIKHILPQAISPLQLGKKEPYVCELDCDSTYTARFVFYALANLHIDLKFNYNTKLFNKRQ